MLVVNNAIKEKTDCYALMQFNTSRFKARVNADNSIMEMDKQDRNKWNKELINNGTHYLNEAIKGNHVSIYFILAAISANHCIAKSFNDTNWSAIFLLYDHLLRLEDSPTVRLNRTVALAKIKGNKKTITECKRVRTKF